MRGIVMNEWRYQEKGEWINRSKNESWELTTRAGILNRKYQSCTITEYCTSHYSSEFESSIFGSDRTNWCYPSQTWLKTPPFGQACLGSFLLSLLCVEPRWPCMCITWGGQCQRCQNDHLQDKSKRLSPNRALQDSPSYGHTWRDRYNMYLFLIQIGMREKTSWTMMGSFEHSSAIKRCEDQLTRERADVDSLSRVTSQMK